MSKGTWAPSKQGAVRYVHYINDCPVFAAWSPEVIWSKRNAKDPRLTSKSGELLHALGGASIPHPTSCGTAMGREGGTWSLVGGGIRETVNNGIHPSVRKAQGISMSGRLERPIQRHSAS